MRRENVEEFIGQRFGKEGQIEVIEWDGSMSFSNKLYTIKCHECSKDPELFGDGTFKCTKNTLTTGKIPCGCSKYHHWTKEQYATKIRRVCDKIDYKFLGYAGDWKSNNTKLSLVCNRHQYSWETTRIGDFLRDNGRGCSKCASEVKSRTHRKEDSIAVTSFMQTGKFLEGTEFKRSSKLDSKGYSTYWQYTCPVCSNDEYVINDLCSGVFESSQVHLLKGWRSCRCATTYRWSSLQREYKIKQLIAQEGLPIKFSSWKGEFKGNKSLMTLSCAVHREWTTRLDDFISARHRCPSCAKTGYDPAKTGYLYVIKAGGPCSDFTGYGVTNVPASRFATHRRNFQSLGIKIEAVEFVSTSGQIALDIENQIKYSFPCNPQEIEGFKREATYSHLYENVVDFVKAKLKLFEEYQDNQNILCYSEDIDTAIVQRRNCLEELYHERETNTCTPQH